MAKQAFFKKVTLAVGAGITMIGQSLTISSNGVNIPNMLGEDYENSQGLMGGLDLRDPFFQQELDIYKV